MKAIPRDVADIPPLSHAEAMELAADEYERFLSLVRDLSEEDWSRPTDCELWDVRALVSHVAGAAAGCASMREMGRQQLRAMKAARSNSTSSLDEWTGLHVTERKDLRPHELIADLMTVFPRALKGRRRVPAPLRALPFPFPEPINRRAPLAYLYDTIFTRDTWMHRIDVSRAVDRPMVLDPGHDGRIVEDVVRDWASLHGRPFTLVLEGVAGGTFTRGSGGEALTMDATEFCRGLTGRGGPPALDQPVPF